MVYCDRIFLTASLPITKSQGQKEMPKFLFFLTSSRDRQTNVQLQLIVSGTHKGESDTVIVVICEHVKSRFHLISKNAFLRLIPSEEISYLYLTEIVYRYEPDNFSRYNICLLRLKLYGRYLRITVAIQYSNFVKLQKYF